MTGLKFEGVAGISEVQSDFIKKVLEERGFTDNKVIFEDVGKATTTTTLRDNYTSTVKRVVIEKADGGTFKMIAKIASNDEMMRAVARVPGLFRNETVVYQKILPKFKEIEQAAGISSDEMLTYPEIYGALDEPPNEVILLEDLKESGYVMLDRSKSLDDVQVKSILQNFAKLHALSYALKYKEPETFQDFKNRLFDVWQTYTPESKMFFDMFLQQAETNTMMVLDKDEHKRVFKGQISKVVDIINKLNKADDNAKQIVIQQGDAWTNNIMYKLESGPIPKSIMIDYQQPRVANHVMDLFYMIFNCTDYQTRKEHYLDWIDLYHSQLDNALSNFGLKANFVYPKDLLDADLKRYGKVALILAVMLAGVMISKPEDAARIKDAFESGQNEELSKNANVEALGLDGVMLYKVRVEGVINSLLEFGLV